MPLLCRFEKWTLGMNRTGWVSRSVSGLRNVISFPLKPESKQPFRPTDGKSSSEAASEVTTCRERTACPRSPKRILAKKRDPAEPGLRGCPELAPLGRGTCQAPGTVQKGWLVLMKGFARRPGKDLTDKLVLMVLISSGANSQGQILWKLTDKPPWIATRFRSGDKHEH